MSSLAVYASEVMTTTLKSLLEKCNPIEVHTECNEKHEVERITVVFEPWVNREQPVG